MAIFGIYVKFLGVFPENGWLEDDSFPFKMVTFRDLRGFSGGFCFHFWLDHFSIGTMEPGQLIFVASLLNVNCLVGIELQKNETTGAVLVWFWWHLWRPCLFIFISLFLWSWFISLVIHYFCEIVTEMSNKILFLNLNELGFHDDRCASGSQGFQLLNYFGGSSPLRSGLW